MMHYVNLISLTCLFVDVKTCLFIEIDQTAVGMTTAESVREFFSNHSKRSFFIGLILIGTIFNLLCASIFLINWNGLNFVIPLFNSTSSSYHPVNRIDLNTPITEDFICLKTKQLFKVVRTTICVHNRTDFVSRHFLENMTYEEEYMHTLFRIMLRYPHYGLIDVGANIGTYTMFAAAINRLVIAIECFRPNYLRIAKAIQIENLQNNVILIGNAIYSQSGRFLNLSSEPENIGGQATSDTSIANKFSDDPHIVETIRFDDILPIIKSTERRAFLLKADIEASEHHLFDSGTEIFEYLDIPVIIIEWDRFRDHIDRGAMVLSFLTKHGYIPTVDTCQRLNITDTFIGWPANVYWMKTNSSDIC